MKNNIHTSNESNKPLLSTSRRVTTNRKSIVKLTGSFNALIPSIQQIAKKIGQVTTKHSTNDTSNARK